MNAQAEDLFHRYIELRTSMELARMFRMKDTGESAGLMADDDYYAVKWRGYNRQAETLESEIVAVLRKVDEVVG